MKRIKYDKLDVNPYGIHQKIIQNVKKGDTILELGCASGYMSNEFVRKGAKVWGVEMDNKSAKKAEKYCEHVFVRDLNNPESLEDINKSFSLIIIADVLEHLINPIDVLKRVSLLLSLKGRIIISVPNIAFITNRLNLMRGRFEYTNTGIMDETHLKFFTKKGILKLMDLSGLKVYKFEAVGNFTQLPLYMQTLYPLIGKMSFVRRLEKYLTSLLPEALGVQFLLICRKK